MNLLNLLMIALVNFSALEMFATESLQIQNIVCTEQFVDEQKIPQTPFYFLRHGMTDWNKEMLIEGPQDLSLNEKGKSQVIESIEILKGHPISCIFTSPLNRCLETAQMVSDALNHIPIFVLLDLEERKFGDWSQCKDKAKELVESAPEGPGFFQHIKDKIESILPNDAETLEEFEKRIFFGVCQALNESMSYPSYPLILGHGCVKIACKKAMKTIGDNDNPKTFTQPMFFSPDEGSWKMLNLD